jgi:hypothetical protein
MSNANAAFEIHEVKPTGEGSMQALIDKMTQSAKRSDDMSETFRELAKGISEDFAYEFSSANPAGWDALSPMYNNWKIQNGFPITIGIMTGALKSSLTTDAIVDAGPKQLLYKYNPGVKGHDGKSTGDYAKDFNEKRPIMDYVKKTTRTRIKEAVKKSLKFAKGE